MCKLLFIISTFLFVSTIINAQEIITSSGGSIESKTTMVNYTIGEPITETVSAGNATVTSGFNQPSIKIETVVENLKTSLKVSVFPNPTSKMLNIEFDGQLPITAKVTALNGTVISNLKIVSQQTKLDFSNYKEGVYLIEITNNLGISNTYRIVKQ